VEPLVLVNQDTQIRIAAGCEDGASAGTGEPARTDVARGGAEDVVGVEQDAGSGPGQAAQNRMSSNVTLPT
jgi:hypothetical protein